MDSRWAKKRGEKKVSNQARRSIEAIVQNYTRPVQIFCMLILLWGAARAAERRTAGKFEPLPVLCK